MIAAAIVPHPPLLVPALAAGAAADVADLLLACDQAVAAVLAYQPVTVVCVGGGSVTERHPRTAWGSLGGYGLAAGGPPVGAGAPTLPLSLTIGRWLLDRAGWRGDTVVQEVATATGAAACAALGARLAADTPDPAVWLVLGDGTNRRTVRAPGALDPAAEPFDAAVAAALAAADPPALLALDVAAADRLGVAGRAAWQVLAGAVGRTHLSGRLDYSAAPFGVGYTVALWAPPR